MGKYMRKAKASGEVAVMEVSGGALLGVRTRSRTLALQRAKGEPGETAEYLELRSRRLEKPPHPQAAARRSAAKKTFAAAPAEDAVEDQVSFGENVLDFDAMERSIRETTPCSLIRNSETIRTPGSTTKTSEQETQHAFRERYNFCPVNDCPLPGRYEWVRLDC
ncbi:hypothetical protein QOZ80_3BG0294990 [Eleusine coracana subsp. coracana]|nr:hypothetical protein QOZ80_3BG0294990 [Eleusine coracana subsp. coracana]